MTETAAQLIAVFDTLTVAERHELLIEMLRRSGELPDSIVSDDQLVGIADELFQSLDAEESNGNDAESR
jgi:hypothetical protein